MVVCVGVFCSNSSANQVYYPPLTNKIYIPTAYISESCRIWQNLVENINIWRSSGLFYLARKPTQISFVTTCIIFCCQEYSDRPFSCSIASKPASLSHISASIASRCRISSCFSASAYNQTDHHHREKTA